MTPARAATPALLQGPGGRLGLRWGAHLAHAQGSPVAAARTSRSFEREPRGRYDKAAKRALREGAGTLAVR